MIRFIHLAPLSRLIAAMAAAIVGVLATAAEEPPPDLQALVGQTVDVRLTSGRSWGDAKVEKIRPGTAPGSIRALTIMPSDPPRQQTIGAQLIDEIVRDGTPLDVAYDKKNRELVHSPERRKARFQREAAIAERVRAKKGRFWKEISPADQEKYTAEEKESLQQASRKMGVAMQFMETRYYLVGTDMPVRTVGGYVKYLDAMYEQLTKAFDFPQGKNIWRGKCVVVAFQNSNEYHRFERELMDNTESQGTQALCHLFGSGRVLISCYKGTSEGFFAVVLVHETAHGFVHRYKSSIFVPSWINEGIADWVAGAVVGKHDDEVRNRQRDAIDRVRRSGTLGPSFFENDGRLESWQYGAASSLVDLMLRIDPKKYRKLIDNIKEGMESEEALRDAFGFGRAELAARYAAMARTPNARP